MNKHKVIQSYLILCGAFVVLGFFLWNSQWILSIILVVFVLIYSQFERLVKIDLSAGKLSVSLSELLGKKKSEIFEQQFNEILENYENRTGRTLSQKTVENISSTIEEGFNSRIDELEERLKTKFRTKDEANEAAIEQAKKAMELLLSDADGRKKEVSIAELNRSVEKNFCQVWPFC